VERNIFRHAHVTDEIAGGRNHFSHNAQLSLNVIDFKLFLMCSWILVLYFFDYAQQKREPKVHEQFPSGNSRSFIMFSPALARPSLLRSFSSLEKRLGSR